MFDSFILVLTSPGWDANPSIRPSIEETEKDFQKLYEQYQHISYSDSDFEGISFQGPLRRGDAEKMLKDSPPLTFLTRWSERERSFIISYKREDSSFGHINGLQPVGSRIVIQGAKEPNDTFESLAACVNEFILKEKIKYPYTYQGPGTDDYTAAKEMIST